MACELRHLFGARDVAKVPLVGAPREGIFNSLLPFAGAPRTVRNETGGH